MTRYQFRVWLKTRPGRVAHLLHLDNVAVRFVNRHLAAGNLHMRTGETRVSVKNRFGATCMTKRVTVPVLFWKDDEA